LKAVILAAGKGERLKEITKKIPKPMILYKNKPVIEYNIELCKKYGIKDIFINTHYLKESIQEYFDKGRQFGVNISYSYEEELLGTAGALNNFKEFLIDSPFFVIYGDNISNFNLNLLIKKLEATNSVAIIGFHYREDVIHSGVAEFDKNDKILKFIEKPRPGVTDSKWVNAGVYLLKPEIFKYIPSGFSDFGKDVFSSLLKQNVPIYGVKQKKDVKVFDTPEMLKKSME